MIWEGAAYHFPGVMQMTCAWKELLDIIPGKLAQQIDTFGKEKLLELRLRKDSPAELVLTDRVVRIGHRLTRQELEQCVNSASRYSPWTSATASKGFITAPGGHRIGLCGEAVVKDGAITAIKDLRSLCIRVARDIPGVCGSAEKFEGSVLILGAPGWGKTTLLRDLARSISSKHNVGVIDERSELFPEGFLPGCRMDILTGCPKVQGIEMMLRTMSPEYIAVDEITAQEDTVAILKAYGCGVRLLATAHADSLDSYRARVTYRPLTERKVFDTAVVLRSDRSFTAERIQK